jgi:hypothetical protein
MIENVRFIAQKKKKGKKMKKIKKQIHLCMNLPVEITIQISYIKGQEEDFEIEDVEMSDLSYFDTSDINDHWDDHHTKRVLEQISDQNKEKNNDGPDTD